MDQKADWKALSKADWEADPFPDWVPDLNYECSHGPAASRFGRLDHEQNQRTTCRNKSLLRLIDPSVTCACSQRAFSNVYV